MKVAVTGGSGLLGTAVLRKLASNRAVKSVVSVDRRPPIVAIKKVTAVEADVRDPDLARHFEGCDAVVHLAFIVTTYAPRDVMRSVNVEGSKNVFESAARANVGAIVYSSSVAAYGVVPDHPTPIVEDTPRKLQTAFPYAADKYEVEAFLDRFEAERPAIAIARLRPGIVLGARVDHALGRSLDMRILVDNGAPPMPFVWDEDVAAAVMLCLKERARGAYNLVADEPRSAADLARASGLHRVRIPRALGAGVGRLQPIILALGGEPAVERAWLDEPFPALVYASEKAKRELGWTPKYPTASDVLRGVGEAARGITSPKIALFMKLAQIAAAHAPPREDRLDAHVHLEITGPGGADYAIHIEGGATRGTTRIEAGIPRPPTTVVTLRASTFLDVLAGKESTATLELTGKMRVEGEPIGAMVLAALATMLKAAASERGARGLPARALSRWIAT